MKKLLPFLILLASFPLLARAVISAINITLPVNPDAFIACVKGSHFPKVCDLTVAWGDGQSNFAITATAARQVNGTLNPSDLESRILVAIKQNGIVVAGSYTNQSAPAARFSAPTKVWSGSSAMALLGKDCTLPPGDYELSVQFFGDDQGKPVPLSVETIRPFTIKGDDQQNMSAIHGQTAPSGAVVVTAPQGLAPIGAIAPTAPATRSEPNVAKNYTQGSGAESTRSPPTTGTKAYITDNDSPRPQDRKAANAFAAPGAPAQAGKAAPVFGLGMAKAYQPPQALAPADGTVLTEADIMKPITFRWTPVVPPPTGGATYRLQVFEILPGQTPMQAFRSNRPILDEEVENTAKIEVSGLEPSAGKAARSEVFAWNVQALDRDGKPIGSNNGTSEARSFTATVHP